MQYYSTLTVIKSKIKNISFSSPAIKLTINSLSYSYSLWVTHTCKWNLHVHCINLNLYLIWTPRRLKTCNLLSYLVRCSNHWATCTKTQMAEGRLQYDVYSTGSYKVWARLGLRNIFLSLQLSSSSKQFTFKLPSCKSFNSYYTCISVTGNTCIY